MARVQLILDFPDMTTDDLRALVVANDAGAAGVDNAVNLEAVTGEAVVLDWARGDTSMDGDVVYSTIDPSDRYQTILDVIMGRPNGDILNIVQAARELPGTMSERFTKAFAEVTGDVVPL